MLVRASRCSPLLRRQSSLRPAWAARILTARGLEVGQSEAIRRYRQLNAVFRTIFPGSVTP